ncbi:hypothetical protein [Halorubrum aethiopicum]|uniref:hypothetical protein n=1 Tax=Halorubrum aethiopicum TaxID=1758255 RepID=UPI0008329A8E|nr:hypothetical protein [Halorubrum aethiopicum]
MASKQPTHGSSARTKEFDIDLAAEGSGRHRGPNYVLAEVSVDANFTLRIEIEAANQYDWQLDARFVDGSLEVGDVFCEGDSVPDDMVPSWVERVVGVVGRRLAGGR